MDDELWSKTKQRRQLMIMLRKGQEELCRKKIENLRRVVAEEEQGSEVPPAPVAAAPAAETPPRVEVAQPIAVAAPAAAMAAVAQPIKAKRRRSGPSPRQRLTALNEMLEAGFVSQDEYDDRRKAILASM